MKLSPEERARHIVWLHESGILGVVERSVKRMTAPLYWADWSRPDGSQVLHTGTICFIHTGARLLGVTNRHVHDSCVKALADGPQVTCQIGGASFDPAARLIDRSEHYDLVTYDISEVQTNGADADIHYAPTWPPAVDPEGLVIVGGWLNAFRAEGENETTHSFLHFYAYTRNVSEEQIGVVTYTSKSIPWGSAGLPVGTDLGGMSGGPVFLIREDPLTKIVLIGINYEYHDSFEIVLARPLSLINEHGAIQS